MKTLYIECNMGAAGDMLMAALLELHDNPKEFLHTLNNIGIPNVVVNAEPSTKCGIAGTHVNVAIHGHEEDDHVHGDHHEHSHDHEHHNTYHGVEHLIGHLHISDNVKKNVLAVYKLIAEAESHVHGVPVHQIHFHEVGEMDAIADIVGVCLLMEELAPDVVLASPVNTGSGYVHCAHGLLPVPAPATAHILHNIPIYSDETKGELCTPTGAALLKHFVKTFCKMPELAVNKLGYGMGKKDFEKANCVRAYLGNTAFLPASNGGNEENVTELSCNLDDMTAETLAFAQQLLLDEGALDVWTAPIGMKKNRTGILLTCLCRSEAKEKMLSLMFKHTTTLGIRENAIRRYTLQREQTEVATKHGTVRIKTAYGFGVRKSKPEYEDAATIAREKGLPIQEVLQAAMKLCDTENK